MCNVHTIWALLKDRKLKHTNYYKNKCLWNGLERLWCLWRGVLRSASLMKALRVEWQVWVDHVIWQPGRMTQRRQWSRIRRFPDTILFSNIEPAGISIRSPWLAIMMTVPCQNSGIIKTVQQPAKTSVCRIIIFHIFLALTFRETCFPKVTSPDTVKWSSSSMSGMLSNRVRYSWTWRTTWNWIKAS